MFKYIVNYDLDIELLEFYVKKMIKNNTNCSLVLGFLDMKTLNNFVYPVLEKACRKQDYKEYRELDCIYINDFKLKIHTLESFKSDSNDAYLIGLFDIPDLKMFTLKHVMDYVYIPKPSEVEYRRFREDRIDVEYINISSGNIEKFEVVT